jgi:hypothetical protein
MLTSWGIAVILTVRALYRPSPPPINVPTMMIGQARPSTLPVTGEPRTTSWTAVTTTAMAMPRAEIWLPRRALTGEFIMCRPTTKSDAANT